MKPLPSSLPEVFYEELKEHRGDYYVIYNAATSDLGVAWMVLVFLKRAEDLAFVSSAMESELEHWLRRFPVPLRVASVDEKEENIHLSPLKESS